ncbi:hypothetical protein [Deinococcus sonorensis]|uniref:DUF3298 domain-containing protein n=2 Tax=Deinococcus sonorensis TaxID=309891 RepID=A0AAU7UCU5_9DEIO
MRLLALLAALTVPAAAHAAPTPLQACSAAAASALPTGVSAGVYRGTLGTQAVTLELGGPAATGDTPDRYSYDRYGLDLPLVRGRAADRTANYTLVLAEAVETYPDPKPSGCLILNASGTGLSGQWRTPDGKKQLPARLQRINVAAQPLQLPASPGLLKLRSSDPYTFLKLNRRWISVKGGVQEPLSGVTYPRVVGGTTALNLALQDRQLALAADALECRGGNRELGGDYSGGGTLSWQSAHLISLHEDVDYYCGGAHPDAYTAGVTLDARTGQEMTLTGKPASLWPGLTPARVQAMYLAAYPQGPDDAECREALGSEDGRSSEYASFQLYLTRQGLAVWPGFLPHVILACAETVTLPYARLRPLANTAHPAFRDVYR